LKRNYDGPLSNFAFNFNLRRYIMASPVAVSQLARLLETLGRSALVRPDAATALLQRLFAILGRAIPTTQIGWGGQTGIWTFLELIDGRPYKFTVRQH